MKQPRVPEYSEKDDVDAYLRALNRFLKDFSMDAWSSIRNARGGIGGMYAFYVDENGHLICTYDMSDPPPFAINENGHLIYTIGG